MKDPWRVVEAAIVGLDIIYLTLGAGHNTAQFANIFYLVKNIVLTLGGLTILRDSWRVNRSSGR